MLLESAWLGVLDRRRTSSESSGWRHATDRPGDFLGDADRLVRSENTAGYLIWEAPNLRQFRVRLYAREPVLEQVLRLAVSPDGEKWVDLPYSVEVAGQSAAGWLALGDVPSDLGARWFRLTLAESSLPPGQVQVGQVELVGFKDAEE